MSSNSSDAEWHMEGDGVILPDESSANKYTWAINDFFERYDHSGIQLRSPAFTSSIGHCLLGIYHDSETCNLIFLYMTFEDVQACHRVHWKLGIKHHDGSVFESTEGVRRIVVDGNMSDGTFVTGYSKFHKEDICPEGDLLKVMCEFRFDGHEGSTDTSSQTDQIWRCDALARNLKTLLLNGEGADATVRVKGQNFQVHRAIIQARTPVFSAMFRHDMSEKVTGVVDIEDCDPDTFLRFLHYVYVGAVEDVSSKNATSLFEVADKYQVKELKSDCLALIQEGMSVETFCKTVTVALRHGEIALLKLATEFFSNNMKEIIVTVDWQKFICNYPIEANELFIKAVGAEK